VNNQTIDPKNFKAANETDSKCKKNKSNEEYETQEHEGKKESMRCGTVDKAGKKHRTNKVILTQKLQLASLYTRTRKKDSFSDTPETPFNF
jgi:hypothetical protein